MADIGFLDSVQVGLGGGGFGVVCVVLWLGGVEGM